MTRVVDLIMLRLEPRLAIWTTLHRVATFAVALWADLTVDPVVAVIMRSAIKAEVGSKAVRKQRQDPTTAGGPGHQPEWKQAGIDEHADESTSHPEWKQTEAD
jgi:hypothetical protein